MRSPTMSIQQIFQLSVSGVSLIISAVSIYISRKSRRRAEAAAAAFGNAAPDDGPARR